MSNTKHLKIHDYILLFALFIIITFTVYDLIGDNVQNKYSINSFELTNLIYDDNIYDIHKYDTTTIEGLNNALDDSNIDKKYYEINTYNCREFSVALSTYLQLYGFDSGLTDFYPDKDSDDIYGHRIVWVKLDNGTIFVEPQNDKIYNPYTLYAEYNESTVDNINIIILRDYKMMNTLDITYYYKSNKTLENDINNGEFYMEL